MSKKNKYRLGDRKDFWNVPCNPITGYRIQKQAGSLVDKEVPQLFFTDDHKIIKPFS